MHRLSVVVIGMMTFIILVRLLTQHDYGIWMLFVSISAIMEVLRNGFIRNPLVKYINTTEKSDYTKLSNSALYLNLFFTIFTSAVLLISAPGISTFLNAPELTELLLIYIITNFLLIPFSHYEFIQQANFQFKGTFISYFLRTFLLFVYAAYCYLSNTEIDLSALAYVNAATVLIGTIPAYIYSRKFLTPLTLPHSAWLLKLFQYGKYTFGTNLNSILSRNIDHWLLGHLISPASVAIYNPAIRITNLVEVPTMALSTILFPKIAEASKENDLLKVKKLYEKSIGVILAVMLPVTVGVLVLSEYIILILAGEAYAESIPILRITILYALYIPFLRFFGNVLDAMNRPHINFYFVLTLAIANIILNYAFITTFGVIGAAYGTTSAFALAFVLNQIYLKIHFNISTVSCIRETFKAYGMAVPMLLNLLSKRNRSQTSNP